VSPSKDGEASSGDNGAVITDESQGDASCDGAQSSNLENVGEAGPSSDIPPTGTESSSTLKVTDMGAPVYSTQECLHLSLEELKAHRVPMGKSGLKRSRSVVKGLTGSEGGVPRKVRSVSSLSVDQNMDVTARPWEEHTAGGGTEEEDGEEEEASSPVGSWSVPKRARMSDSKAEQASERQIKAMLLAQELSSTSKTTSSAVKVECHEVSCTDDGASSESSKSPSLGDLLQREKLSVREKGKERSASVSTDMSSKSVSETGSKGGKPRQDFRELKYILAKYVLSVILSRLTLHTPSLSLSIPLSLSLIISISHSLPLSFPLSLFSSLSPSQSPPLTFPFRTVTQDRHT
jgi:hypothetical protein